jgi:predicted ATPase
MVGRDQELALVLERWRQAVAGEGQAVLLVGEAGIGKSRLVQATLDAIAMDDHLALRYQCSPLHTGTALWPVAQQLGVAAGLLPADTEAAKLDKLEALLREGLRDVRAGAPLIAALFGIEAGSCHPGQDLTPQQRRNRTLEALVEHLLGLARRCPVLMVLEDAHWIDPTTLELLGQALDRIAGARVLLLLTSRPDNQPALGGHPHVTRLTLNRLGRGPTEAIVARLTGGRSLPREMLAEITARTDGVPLFIEELTKAVLEAAGTTVPASLHASLMARLDRVPGVKEVAQVAACIGREFTYPLLAAVSLSPEAELRTALDRLAAAELVFSRGTPPEATYAFKHALVRDAAHESLLNAQRQQLHGRIAQVLEQRFPEMADTEPELLAQHCAAAGFVERAVDYWLKAGERAIRRSATAEAVAQLGKGLDLLMTMPASLERGRQELQLQVALGRALVAAKGYAAPEMGRTFVRARELCEEVGDTVQLFPVLFGQFAYHQGRAEPFAAREVAEDMLRLAEAAGDLAGRVAAHRALGSALSNLGELAAARAHLERALALYDPVLHRSLAFVYPQDERVAGLCWLSRGLHVLGYPDQAMARSREAVSEARDLAHPYTLAHALLFRCKLCALGGDRPGAEEQAEAVTSLCTEQGFPFWLALGRILQGWALAQSGRVQTGIAQMQQGLETYWATGGAHWSPYLLALMAEAHGKVAEAATALDLLANALVRVERTGERWYEAELHRCRGELLLSLAEFDHSEAEVCFDRAITVACKQSARMWELRAATSLARLWRDQGRRAEAHDLLAPVYAWFTEGFDTADLKDAKALLDELK